MTNKRKRIKILTHEREIKMIIKYTKELKPDLPEKLTIAKKDCLTATDIPFCGITHQIQQDNTHTTIYSLLPGLEDAEIVKIEDLNDTNFYLIKKTLVASISNEQAILLLEHLQIAKSLLEHGKLEELRNLVLIPSEIQTMYQILDNLTKDIWLQGKIDDLYSDFANLVGKMRNLQKEYINQVSINEPFIRAKKL